MMKQLYKFGKYPLVSLLNQDEGTVGIDSQGNLLQVEDGQYMQIARTPLTEEFNVEGLDYQQANLLFSQLSNEYYRQYGVELYKNQLKFE